MAEPSRIDQLRRSLAQLIAPAPSPEPQSPMLATSVSSTIAELERVFAVERTRMQRLRDYDEMDQGDVAAMLNAITNACLVSDDGSQIGFKVRVRREVTSGKKYQTVVDQMLTDTALQPLIRQYVRKTLKRGDTFLEVVFDDAMNIRRLKSVPPSVMRVNVDQHGDLKTGTQVIQTDMSREQTIPEAYHQVDELQRIVAAWFPWEMVHLKWLDDDELIYSDGSFIEPIRRDWRRQTAIEDAMAVARIDRAYLREIHYVDIEGKSQQQAEEAIKNYKRQLEQMNVSDERRAEWPRRTRSNLFVGKRNRRFQDRMYDDLNKIEVIDPRNAGLENIADIQYLQKKLFRELPAEVLGVGNVQGNDLTQQDVAASKLYQYCQWVMSHRLIIPLCMTAIKLKGFMPIPSDFEVVWPTVIIRGSWRFADAQFRLSMAHTNYIEWGITSRKRVAKDVYRLDDEEWENEVEQVKGEQGELPQPGGQSNVQQRRQGNQSA